MKKNKNLVFRLVLLLGIWGIMDFGYGAELPPNTVITSDRVEMDSRDGINVFKFFDNVHLEGEGLDAVCDYLEVIAKKTEGESANLSNADSLEKITGIGHVYIKQEGRTIKAGHAVLYPEEGKVVLTESPEVTDSQGTVKGDKITFYKNDGKAYVEGGAEGGRPKIIFPGLPDLKKEPKDTGPIVQKAEKVETKEFSVKKN